MKLSRLTILFGLLLVACGRDGLDDVKEFVKNSESLPRGKIEPLPEVKPYEPFTYNAFDLPDPFKPRKIEAKKGDGKGAPDLSRRKEALEAYPLESLKMVGTLNQNKQTYALIKTPDQTLYRVRVGNYLGQNFGVITQITDSIVKLKESVQDPGGDWTERESSLQLQEEQEQKK